MISRFTIITLVLLFPFLVQAQREIQVVYNDQDHNLMIDPDIKVIEAGERYRLKIQNINPVYIQDHVRIKSFRYISPTPEILKPLLPGIPSTNVFDHFEIKPSGQREFFLKSLRFFNELELLRSASDDLYARTRLKPNTTLADAKMEHIQSIFDTTGLQEIVGQIIYYQDYIFAAESIYKNNLKKITLLTPDADVVLKEYTRITRIADKIRRINYIQLLDFIVQSIHTQDYILSQEFTGEKDISEIHLALYDSYINDTIYSGTLTFHTERNWAVDFSTGLFYTNLYKKDYYLAERTPDINDVIEEKKFRGDVSVGALVHLSYKFKPHLRIGPTVGASISPFDGNIRYLAGISAFIGKEKIIGVSTGISLGQSEVLSSGVTTDAQGPYLPADENKIPTYDQTKTGFFIGVTYNFTRTKKP